MKLVAELRRPSWSPYAAGVGLGILVTVTVGALGHRLSGAAVYQHLSGYTGRVLVPGSVYWTHVVPTGLTWDVLVAVGGLVGALLAAAFSGTLRLRVMPDRLWTEAFGSSVALRWLLAFVGATFTEIGGGIAGGCTASLAVSGGAMLAPAAFLFVAGMFAGGIPTAAIALRRVR